MTPFEIISLGVVILSACGSAAAVLLTALVSVLYAVARMRDRETQDTLRALTGHADGHAKAIVQLQEQVKPIVSLDDKLDRLTLAVAELASKVGSLGTRKRA